MADHRSLKEELGQSTSNERGNKPHILDTIPAVGL